MKAMTVVIAAAATFALIGAYVLAQEIVATPDPIGGVKTEVNAGSNAGTVTPPRPAPGATKVPTKDDWRYRWYEGRWWYWMPDNHWMWYTDDGHWVNFDANRNRSATTQSDASPPNYSGPYYYYPAPGYWTGYYPGTVVGVGPYGNVNVGVGRRVGVDVWGPHGGVRVGRIYVGW
jgi:hypothetical protein